jgi:hypothetical protein
VIRKRSALNQGAKSFGGEVSADVCERIECGTLDPHALEAQSSQPDVKALKLEQRRLLRGKRNDNLLFELRKYHREVSP